jgi:hypothetical protein
LGVAYRCIVEKVWLYPLSTGQHHFMLWFSFVQQVSSVDFQKEELDHACWGSSRISVAGVGVGRKHQEVADLQG